MSHDLVLSGCVSTVLGSYLKALGVHRLVAEQLDPSAMSCWDRSGHFHLVSSADRKGLIDFFVHRYAPTPLVTPWNGGSGFYARDQQDGIQAIARSDDKRFASYREVIDRCRGLLESLRLIEKPDDKEAKFTLLRHARACLPDEAVAWLDAAYVIGEEARYPALLGTGGNDGRLDFANNFMQRVAGLFLAPEARGGSAKRAINSEDGFTASIFGVPHRGALQPAAVGQFVPACAHRATRVASDVIGRTAQAGKPDRRRPGCRHEGRPTLERGGIRVLAPRKRAVSPSASGQHGSEGVTSPARQGEMWEKMGPNRKSRLIRRGRRVGVAATSHKAIHNLLDEIEEAAPWGSR